MDDICNDIKFLSISTKKNLGQFYTKNYSYILNNLNIPEKTTKIIEPFAGEGDLLEFIKKKCDIECYDIDPKKKFIINRDTLLNPPDYSNKFVLTNPPYLARNKSVEKGIFDKYNQNDLYKCFLLELTHNTCSGGILIIPLNFWCSIRKSDIELRKKFLAIYDILTINIFEEKVFKDTSYSICSFQFEKKEGTKKNIINFYIYPEGKKINFELCEENNFTIVSKPDFPSVNIIYMTATPKIYKGKNETILSMDNKEIYGEQYTY